ncbi:MAG: carbohydrate ABC transporter permease, partial [Ardenticatenaceae bacterium]
MSNPYLNTLLWAAGTVAFIVFSSLAVGHAARWAFARRREGRQAQSHTFAGYFFVSPWLVGFFIFVAGPMLASLYWSFTNYRLPQPPEWVGLENYTRLLLEDKDFRAALVNTLFLTVVGVPLQMGTALGLALLLSQGRRGERFFRAAFYLPVVLGLNAAALLAWRLMLNANNGLVNLAIRRLRDLLPLVGWLNRAFIWVMELANAFFLSLQQANFTLLARTMEAG